MRLIVTFILLLLQPLFVNCSTLFTCPNNDKCQCQIKSIVYEIVCPKLDVFPTFTLYDFTGHKVSIYVEGTVNYIPPNCLAQIQSADNIYLEISYKNGPSNTMNISQNAFDGITTPVDLNLNYYQFNSIPTDWISKLNGFQLNYGSLTSVQQGAFSGFSGQQILLNDNGHTTMDQNAFDGLHPIESFTFNLGNATDITALKFLKTCRLEVANNIITILKNYSFCQCDNSTCPNPYLQTLILYQNLMVTIEYNAFANLPNLTYLNLIHNKLRSIPGALNLVPQLVTLDLELNDIQGIKANTFYNLQSLQTLNLDGNPLYSIEPSAFNGLSLINFTILDAYVEYLDLLVLTGMNNIRTFEFSYSYSPLYVTLSDYTKLPGTLQSITITNIQIATIDSNLQYWFNENPMHTLTLGVDKDFTCTPSIQWMAQYVFCNPPQIYISKVACNLTSLQVTDYLNTFPYTCP